MASLPNTQGAQRAGQADGAGCRQVAELLKLPGGEVADETTDSSNIDDGQNLADAPAVDGEDEAGGQEGAGGVGLPVGDDVPDLPFQLAVL